MKPCDVVAEIEPSGDDTPAGDVFGLRLGLRRRLARQQAFGFGEEGGLVVFEREEVVELARDEARGVVAAAQTGIGGDQPKQVQPAVRASLQIADRAECGAGEPIS
jgi:hypothetical protein